MSANPKQPRRLDPVVIPLLVLAVIGVFGFWIIGSLT